MGYNILVLAFGSFAVGTQAYVFAGLLSELAADLGVGVATAGQLASAFALTFAVCAPFIATMVGGFDRKRVIIAGLVALGAINLLAALAPRFDLLMLLRVASGVASTAIVPIASAAAAQLAPPEQRGRALAIVLGGTTLAFVLGIPVGSVVGGAFGWRATFAYAGLLALLGAVAIALVLPAVKPAGGARPPLSAALNAGVLRHIALTFAAFAATFTVIAFVGPVVELATGAQGARVGFFQMLAGLGSLVGIVVGGRLADSPARARAVPVLFAVMTATLSAYALVILRGPDAALNGWLLAAVIMIGAAALFTLSPIVQAGLVDAAPQASAVALALNGSALFLGQGFGAAIGGAVIATLGYPALGLAAGAISALAVAATAAGWPQPAPPPAPVLRSRPS